MGSVHKRLSALNPDWALVFFNGIQDYFNTNQPLSIVQGCNLVSAECLYKSLQRSFIRQHENSITELHKKHLHPGDIHPFSQECRIWGGQSSHFRRTKYFYPASITGKFETRQAAILSIHKAEIKTALYQTVLSLWSALSKWHTSNGWLVTLPKIPNPRIEHDKLRWKPIFLK